MIETAHFQRQIPRLAPPSHRPSSADRAVNAVHRDDRVLLDSEQSVVRFDPFVTDEISGVVHRDDRVLLESGQSVVRFDLAPKPDKKEKEEEGIDPRDLRDNPDDFDDEDEDGDGLGDELDIEDDDEG